MSAEDRHEMMVELYGETNAEIPEKTLMQKCKLTIKQGYPDTKVVDEGP